MIAYAFYKPDLVTSPKCRYFTEHHSTPSRYNENEQFHYHCNYINNTIAYTDKVIAALIVKFLFNKYPNYYNIRYKKYHLNYQSKYEPIWQTSQIIIGEILKPVRVDNRYDIIATSS